jgi:hypothetical protein
MADAPGKHTDAGKLLASAAKAGRLEVIRLEEHVPRRVAVVEHAKA